MSDAFPLFTRTRADDPETSHAAARRVHPHLNDLQVEVYDVLDKAGANGLTDWEIGVKLGDTKRSTYRTRRSELVDEGIVVWTGQHRKIEGSKRRVWALSKHHQGVEVPAPEKRASTAPNFDLRGHLVRAIRFSRETWGPYDRQKGVAQHIRKELREIEIADGAFEVLKEWIDVIILGLDGAWRSLIPEGLSDEEMADRIIEALVAKQDKNERRDWPDWRTMGQDQAIEHVRGKED